MVRQTRQIDFIIHEFIHLWINSVLDILYLFLLLVEEHAEILFTRLLVVVHYLPQFSEMLLHFALDDLPVSLLYPVEVSLRLWQLVLAILNQVSRTLYFRLYIFHNLWYDFNLRLVQIEFIYALGTHQSMLVVFELTLFYSLFQIRMYQLTIVFFTLLIWTNRRRTYNNSWFFDFPFLYTLLLIFNYLALISVCVDVWSAAFRICVFSIAWVLWVAFIFSFWILAPRFVVILWLGIFLIWFFRLDTYVFWAFFIGCLRWFFLFLFAPWTLFIFQKQLWLN